MTSRLPTARSARLTTGTAEALRKGLAGLAAAMLMLPMITSCSDSHVQAARPAKASPRGTGAPTFRNPPTALQTGLPQVVFHGSRRSRLVALTFDSNLTSYMERELDRGVVRSFDNRALIDELIAGHVPATFFLSGLWMQRYQAEVHRLAGVPWFELGSHSYAHVGFAPHCFHLGLLRPSSMAGDIQRSEQVLHRLDPRATRLFRFPGGCYDRDALRAASEEQVQVIQYDVASGDAFGSSLDAIVRHTVEAARNGSIVVLHVTGGNTAPLTAEVLPRVVVGLRSRGFRFVTVSELLRAQARAGG